MTTFKVPTLPAYSLLKQKQLDNELPSCTLKWRQGQLLVSLEQHNQHPYLPSLKNERWLVECLKHSPVGLIRIDSNLGEASLKFWADACEQANKAVFLRLPGARTSHHRCPRSWWLTRLIDCSAAILLLLVLSPVILGIVCLLRFQSPEAPIFYRCWCVGERGKLFRLFKFRTMVVNTQTLEHLAIGSQNWQKCEDDRAVTPLGHWMRKYSLDRLPQLFNVLRGEMSLWGSRPWSLYEAVRLSLEGQRRLNGLPGIIGSWQRQLKQTEWN